MLSIIQPLLVISIFAITISTGKHINEGQRYATGAIIPEERNPNIPVLGSDYLAYLEIPTEFDAREKWPECPSLKEIRNQFQCESCVAFAVAAAMTDRLCIQSNGKEQFHFSAQEILSCASENVCVQGMVLGTAWLYYLQNGVVSGGPYQSQEGCQPVTSIYQESTVCYNNCTNPDYPIDFKNDLHLGQNLVHFETVEAVQRDILTNGPITTVFQMYDDFATHDTTQVYQRKSLNRIDGHAAKIIGWGVQDDIPYWTVANSWGSLWGDNGFYKIRRGNNECNFEAFMKAAIPVAK